MTDLLKAQNRIIISFDNFDDFDERKPLDSYFFILSQHSPKSLEACKMEGIDPEILIKRDLMDFAGENDSKRIAQIRYNFYEHRRKGMKFYENINRNIGPPAKSKGKNHYEIGKCENY